MNRFVDIWDRAQKGQLVGEKDWNMGLYRTLTELTKKYDITRKKDEWINTDDEILERVFQAAVEFLLGPVRSLPGHEHMLGVGFDALKQREQHRRQQRRLLHAQPAVGLRQIGVTAHDAVETVAAPGVAGRPGLVDP